SVTDGHGAAARWKEQGVLRESAFRVDGSSDLFSPSDLWRCFRGGGAWFGSGTSSILDLPFSVAVRYSKEWNFGQRRYAPIWCERLSRPCSGRILVVMPPETRAGELDWRVLMEIP
ncbi:unnamed protein product, partial [Brassica rapa subsp. narinosa]